MKKQIITIIMLLILPFVASSNSFAHSGRTDANGGHYNRKTGEYHYHNSEGSSSNSMLDTYSIPSCNNDTYAYNDNSLSSITISEDKDFFDDVVVVVFLILIVKLIKKRKRSSKS